MLLIKGSNRNITANFSERELFSKAPGVQEHNLSDTTINGIQIIREFFGAPIYITSTFRPVWYNRSIGSTDTSQHVQQTALDFTFRDAKLQAAYNHDIETRGPLYQKLKAAGIRGFGLYRTFGHIDSRRVLTFWDNRKKKILSQNSEDGIMITTNGRILFALIAVFTLLTIYNYGTSH